MPDDEYMTFCCNDLENPCNFKVQAKTKEEVMEHAKAHVAMAHGMEEISPGMAKKMEASIKPIKVE